MPSAIGSRMSGGLACAMVLPSTNSTMECTIDWGCNDHLDGIQRYPEEQMRLDQLQSLVHQRGRVDGDHRAHVPGRMRERLLQRHRLQLVARASTERSTTGGEG